MRLASAFFAIILLLAGFIFFTPAPQGFPILEYHSVTNKTDPESEIYNVPPAEFSAQLDYLQQKGYTTITLLDYARAYNGVEELPEKPIVLTFDDGYENLYTEMLPILEAHKMKAVVYVITNRLGKPGYLTIEELKEMQARGIEIGSHSADHLPLVTLSGEFLENQIHGSKTFLEWNGLGYIYSFSYPNGVYNREIVEMLKQEKFFTAVTGEAGLNDFNTDPFLLKRVNIRKPRFGIYEFRWRLFKAELFARFRK